MGSRLEEGLRVYAQRMGGFLVERLKEHYGEGWKEAYAQALNEKRRKNFLEDLRRRKDPEAAVDLVHFKDVLLGHRAVFGGLLGRSFQRAVTWADEVAEVRNKWAHQGELSEEEVYRALDNMARILEAVGDGEGAALLKALRDGRALASPQPQTASRPDPLPPGGAWPPPMPTSAPASSTRAPSPPNWTTWSGARPARSTATPTSSSARPTSPGSSRAFSRTS
jgi:hypothetical protein